MTESDKKVARIFTKTGGQYGILTRMPAKEIEAELFETEGPRDPDWVILEGLSAVDDRVIVRICRQSLDCVMIEKYRPSTQRIAAPGSALGIMQ